MTTWFVDASEWFSELHPAWQVVGVLVGGAAAATVGIVAAPVFGAVASAAGLGVAGGTLSGAAASSAGLAALGGGSIASGGLGMAGGTIVVAAVTGATGTGGATYACAQMKTEGQRYRDAANKASNQSVSDNGIHFEGE